MSIDREVWICYHARQLIISGAMELPMQVDSNPNLIGGVYALFLFVVAHGGLALWVYNDSKLQERSGFWALGTFFCRKRSFHFTFGIRYPNSSGPALNANAITEHGRANVDAAISSTQQKKQLRGCTAILIHQIRWSFFW